jgi:hypothetical protein
MAEFLTIFIDFNKTGFSKEKLFAACAITGCLLTQKSIGLIYGCYRNLRLKPYAGFKETGKPPNGRMR